MVNKSVKKIWLVCLCIASLSLVGCFHVPNQDWLPSKNKVNTWKIEKNDEMQQALDSFVWGIDIISSQRGETKNNENEKVETEKINESVIETEGESINDENVDWKTGDIIIEK